MPKIETRSEAWWRQGWFFALALAVITFLAYQPAWNGEPVFDDDDHLTPLELQSFTGLKRIWTELGVVSQYYPITHSVFWLERKLWGDSMLGYHLANIALHLAAAFLLLKVLQRLEVPGAWLAAAIFCLHPVMVESVAWISELKNTLSTVFYLAAALTYVRFDQTRRAGFYAAAFVLFCLGLLSKSVIASLPAALLVVFWWKRGTLSLQKDVRPLIPFFLIGMISGLFTAWVERKFIGAEGNAFELTLLQRLLIAGRVPWFYAAKLFWPADLIFIYPRWQVNPAAWWQYLFPLGALGLIAGVWAVRRRWRGPLAAVLLFGGTLFPVMGFLNVYPFRYSFVADHYQYLASLSVIALASAGIISLLKRWQWGEQRARAVFSMMLLGLAALTWNQCRMYKDVETLWRTTIARNPECFVAHHNLGNHLLQNGKVDEAIQHCRRALEIQPGVAEIHNNLGNALLEKGEVKGALAEYKQAVELKPDLAPAWYNLGAIQLRAGRTDEAMTHFERAIQLRPEYAKARAALGSILAKQERTAEAIRHFQEALRFEPDDVGTLNGFGTALLAADRGDEAIAQFRRALELHPDFVLAHHNLASALLRRGRMNEAIAHFRKIVEIDPASPNAHNNLGWMLREAGHVDESIVHLRKALELRPDYSEAQNNLGRALFLKGEVREAIKHYRTAIQLQSDNARALSNLAWALSTSPDSAIRNGTEAVQLAERANQITEGRDLQTLRALAAAHAEAGQFSNAVALGQQALTLATDQNNPDAARAVRSEIELYQASRPFRESGPANPLK